MKETLSDLIQRRLTELNMKKAELARLVGKTSTYIGELANGTAKTKSGTYRPDPEVVDKLARALQISHIEILVAIDYLPPSYLSERRFGNGYLNEAEYLTEAEKQVVLEVARAAIHAQLRNRELLLESTVQRRNDIDIAPVRVGKDGRLEGMKNKDKAEGENDKPKAA